MDPNRPPDMLPTNHRFGGSQIQQNPRSSGHRRAQSETFYRFPEEFLFDSDPDFNLADIEFPSLSDDNISGSSSTAAPAISTESGGKLEHSKAQTASRTAGGGAHLRSLSVDAAFFEGMGFQGAGVPGGATVEKKPQHRHSSSMDGASSSFEGESPPSQSDYAKKAIAADKLAELALIDPKRAKRILANRQSAARFHSYMFTSELERKVQTLQTEATTLSAQLTLLQRDTTGLTTENRELKLRLQSMEQQAHLRDALNEALREEVQRLKIATGQISNVNGNPFNRGFQQSAAPFFPHQQHLPNQPNHQPQQLLSAPVTNNRAHHHNSPQLQTPSNGLSFGDRSTHDSMDIM
ncbi:transcription factor VIP1-like [Phalaenopsis equestris]|uniref:transcription factor VIP1-like n=1 Tax=Phalaenopsis equestris TaxID=78828 RepID=UPI0009E64CED|nr:transcription factor VIP1-like [Phalaenopsis equestris]